MSIKELVKYLSLINIVGHLASLFALVLFVLHDKFSYAVLLLPVILFTGIPFILAGFVSQSNIENPNELKIQHTQIAVFLFIGLPSLFLPIFFEIGGLLICLTILGLGFWGIFVVKAPIRKMLFVNSVGMLFLLLNTTMVVIAIREL